MVGSEDMGGVSDNNFALEKEEYAFQGGQPRDPYDGEYGSAGPGTDQGAVEVTCLPKVDPCQLQHRWT